MLFTLSISSSAHGVAVCMALVLVKQLEELGGEQVGGADVQRQVVILGPILPVDAAFAAIVVFVRCYRLFAAILVLIMAVRQAIGGICIAIEGQQSGYPVGTCWKGHEGRVEEHFVSSGTKVIKGPCSILLLSRLAIRHVKGSHQCSIGVQLGQVKVDSSSSLLASTVVAKGASKRRCCRCRRWILIVGGTVIR